VSLYTCGIVHNYGLFFQSDCLYNYVKKYVRLQYHTVSLVYTLKLHVTDICNQLNIYFVRGLKHSRIYIYYLKFELHFEF